MNRLWILALLLGMCCASTIPSVEFHDVNGGTTTYESSVPRGSCTTLAAVIADPGLEIFLEYGKCVSYTSLYGIGFLLAAFVTLALNKYFRLLKRSHGSWTTTQKRVLVAIMLSMAFLAGSLGATGEAYSSSMQSATVDDSTGVLVLMNTFLQHSFTFFNAVLKALFAMLDSVIFAIDYIGFILFDAPVILDTIIDDVFDQFDEIGVLLIENSSFTANGQEFECPTCREVGAQSQEARTEYEVEVVPIVEALLGDRIELTEYLVDNKKKIKLGSSRVLEYADLSLDIAQNNWNEAYISINPIWKDAEKTRSTVVTVLFLVPIFVVVFVTLAALAASARLSKCSQNFIWTSWCIVSLCIAIHIPLLLFISDSCVVINDYESDFQGDDSPQAISYRVCVGNEDPDIFFNLSDVLEFRNRVDLTSLDSLDITSNEDLVEFRKTVSDFEELTLDSFGIDTEKVDDQLHLFNTDLDYSPASATYTWETIEFADPDEGENPAASRILRDTIVVQVKAIEKAEAILDDVNYRINVINDTNTALFNNLTDLNTRINLINDQAITPLFNDVDALYSSLECSELGEDYEETTHTMCHSLLGALAGLCLIFTLTLFIAMPMYCFNGVSTAIILDETDDVFSGRLDNVRDRINNMVSPSSNPARITLEMESGAAPDSEVDEPKISSP